MARSKLTSDQRELEAIYRAEALRAIQEAGVKFNSTATPARANSNIGSFHAYREGNYGTNEAGRTTNRPTGSIIPGAQTYTGVSDPDRNDRGSILWLQFEKQFHYDSARVAGDMQKNLTRWLNETKEYLAQNSPGSIGEHYKVIVERKGNMVTAILYNDHKAYPYMITGTATKRIRGQGTREPYFITPNRGNWRTRSDTIAGRVAERKQNIAKFKVFLRQYRQSALVDGKGTEALLEELRNPEEGWGARLKMSGFWVSNGSGNSVFRTKDDMATGYKHETDKVMTEVSFSGSRRGVRRELTFSHPADTSRNKSGEQFLTYIIHPGISPSHALIEASKRITDPKTVKEFLGVHVISPTMQDIMKSMVEGTSVQSAGEGSKPFGNRYVSIFARRVTKEQSGATSRRGGRTRNDR